MIIQILFHGYYNNTDFESKRDQNRLKIESNREICDNSQAYIS